MRHDEIFGQRAVTSVAPQALTLFNGRFVNEQAAHLAARMERDAGDDIDRQIERAYLLALCREPTATERRTMREFAGAEAARLVTDAAAASSPLALQEARHKALEQLCRVIFNLNEFVYPD